MKKILLLFIALSLIITVGLSVGCDKKDASDIYAVSISVSPNKLTYYAGESLDMTGCKLLVRTHSGNDYTVDVTNDMVSGFDNTYGDHTMTISYEVKGATFNTRLKYNVTKPLATKAEIVSAPDKIAYVDGDAVDLTGFVAKVTFSDGSEGERTENAFSVTPSVVSMNTTEIIAKINNISLTIPITVEAKKVNAIKVTTLPKTTYVEGDSFDPTGMKVKYVYNNGEVSGDANYYLSSYEPLLYGDEYVEVIAYNAGEQLTTKVAVTVQARILSVISVDLTEVKRIFLKDMPVDLTGLRATVVCADGTTIVAEKDDLVLYVGGVAIDNKNFTVGNHNIDVYYKYATDSDVHDTFTVTVTAERVLTQFKVISEAEITEYHVGDEVSFRGLWIFGVYNDDSEEQVIDGSDFAEGVTYTPEVIEETTTEIVISYKDLTYSIPITILEE